MNKIDLDVASRHWAVNPLAGPVVLVTTVNAHGWVNIAPKSWVSFVSGKPFRLVLGCHREHHTAINLCKRRMRDQSSQRRHRPKSVERSDPSSACAR